MRIIAVMALAFTLRVAAIVLGGEWANPLVSEPTEQVVLAQSVAAGVGFVSPFHMNHEYPVDHPSAHSPPGFPYLLAGLIRLGEAFSCDPLLAYRFGLLMGALVGAGAAALVSVVAGRLLGLAGFWVCGLLSSFWPTLITGSVILWDTPFAMLAIAWSLGLSVSSARHYASTVFFRYGLLAGAFTIFNPVIAPFMAMGLLVRIVRGASPDRYVRVAAVVFAGWLCCVSPWLIRNAVMFHRFVPIRNNFGLELWMGNAEHSDGTTTRANEKHPMNDPEERLRSQTLGEDAYMQAKSVEARALIREHPGDFLRRSCRRFGLYWLGDLSRPTRAFGILFPVWHGINVIKALLNIGFLVVAAVGLVCGTLGVTRWVALFGVVVLPLPYYVTHVSPNYRATVDTILCLLVAAAILRTVSLWEQTKNSGAAGARDCSA